MSCETFLLGHSWLRRRDPRARVLTGLSLAILVALLPRLEPLLAALALALMLAGLADLPLGPLLKRLRSLNLIMLSLALILPLNLRRDGLPVLGALSWSPQELKLAARIALKANTILLATTALISTLEPVHLGHALHRLGWPSKLVQLLVFTLRYLDALEHERRKLADAMRVRGFQPGLHRHTLRAYSHALGMLLVGSFDRAERILAAMRCRGFAGHFPILDTFCWTRADALFLGLGFLVTISLGGWAWLR